LKAGLDYLTNANFNDIEDGRYLIDGVDLYINIQSYTTKSDADFEAHRDYIDIQYMISGNEKIGVTDYSTCKTTIEYNSEKDIEFLSGNGEYISLNAGEFMILYPKDAHKPSISSDVDNPTNVRKAVVKVHI
ncbi:MAG: YhcH/YjgK/YiaL family protein, partial [Candidatus Gastranaerophilales bacterium]|nr:YhcH/YjgK/YiaL family protein [Candidatus Gastranaerophilales bacterium]